MTKRMESVLVVWEVQVIDMIYVEGIHGRETVQDVKIFYSKEQRKFLVEAYVSLVAYYVVGEFDTRKSAENYLKTITWNREKGFNLVLKPMEEEP
nr:MAG TPA: hypothetical protein [Caudoviricetes sp.]